MDTASEQHDAHVIEDAIPGSSVTVEEVTTPEGEEAEIAVVEKQAEAPRDEMEVGYRYGQLEARVASLEQHNAKLLAQLAAFEAATIAAVEEEAAALEQQGEVLADVAEEVLPPDHEGANAHNPEHQAHKPKWWEALMGGHHGG